jgi:hypothetical protein
MCRSRRTLKSVSCLLSYQTQVLSQLGDWQAKRVHPPLFIYSAYHPRTDQSRNAAYRRGVKGGGIMSGRLRSDPDSATRLSNQNAIPS